MEFLPWENLHSSPYSLFAERWALTIIHKSEIDFKSKTYGQAAL
jgi:hypothetical protein